MLKEAYEDIVLSSHFDVVLILILMEHAQRGHFFVRPSVLISYIEIFTLINVFASKNVPVLCLRQCKGNDFS